ncbi:MAG: NAD(P)-dependent oxidoreductase, partial [Dehalococcoidia bacterium]|nr:NAD(P)-dependent oxidoreductase [Dehalococcoidia bacterium]
TACPLISEREINLMRPGATLVNTSDSSVVNENDVLEALSNANLAGYATDCPGDDINGADENLISSGKLLVTTNPLTNQIGAAQQIAKHVHSNVQSFRAGEEFTGRVEPIDFPSVGDPSFWSSRMSPRQ